ncbi:hypothetical protein LZ838_03345 [Pseudomonas sp. AA27]|uniref:hypothetical protein n=1 Tax=Pseudomonas sp. AA27 TaxID=2908652 RepID=UPI001F387A3B|nr:hypothetical protein [Pseudomonas sp. AA27]MCF1486396.1 hypothetical protein [Pseudomonas sp. AA27]
MDTSLLDDWRALVEGRSDIDKSQFIALFKEHGQPHEVATILEGFKHASELARRTLEVLAAGTLPHLYLLPTQRGTPEQLAAATRRWLDVQADFFERTGDSELMTLTRNARVICKPMTDLKAIDNFDIPGTWASEALGDAVREAADCHTAADYALFEAWYGIAADYGLAWYIAAPLIALDIDFTAYFELWRLGGAILHLGKECWVAQRFEASTEGNVIEP